MLISFTITLPSGHSPSHFWGGEVKAQRSKAIHLRTHSQEIKNRWAVAHNLYPIQLTDIAGLFTYSVSSQPLSTLCWCTSTSWGMYSAEQETRFLQRWTNNDTCRQVQVLAGTSRPPQWGDLIGKNGSVEQPLQPRWSKVPLRGNRDPSPRVRSQPCHRLQKKPSKCRGSEDGQEQKEGMWAIHGKQGPSGKLYLEMWAGAPPCSCSLQ